MHKKQSNSCVRTCKAGCRGEAPARKNIVILRRVRRPLGAEGSRAAPIYKRGAVPVRSGLMCIIVKLKSNVVVCTYKSQNNVKSHCVILILHSDFPYSYTFSWVGAVQTTSPAPRRAKNNLRVTRSFGGKAVCGRRLRMTSFLLKGAAPPSPLLCECEHSFLLIICAYCYMLIFNIRLSVVWLPLAGGLGGDTVTPDGQKHQFRKTILIFTRNFQKTLTIL